MAAASRDAVKLRTKAGSSTLAGLWHAAGTLARVWGLAQRPGLPGQDVKESLSPREGHARNGRQGLKDQDKQPVSFRTQPCST